MPISANKIAVVIPCYKNRNSIMGVLEEIGKNINTIYVVDDACPEHTGEHVIEHTRDSRVSVITHKQNQGVGGAMITGYKKALSDGSDIIVKIDGDGQMDPKLIARFTRPIEEGRSDYTKGNRFYTWECLKDMPKRRLFGNAVLSLVTKISSGYWNIMDPTNGFTAIHAKVLRILPLEKIDRSYFFETDILFRLSLVRAVVVDVPMKSRYIDNSSNLSLIGSSVLFPFKHLKRYIKRIIYQYFIREFNAGTMQLVTGIVLSTFGLFFGAWHWIHSAMQHIATPTGTIMLSAIPLLMGFYSLLGALNYDITNIPKQVLHKLL